MRITSKNDDYNYTKIIDRLIDLLENKLRFQVDKDPARCVLLKLVIGSYKVKAVTQDLTNEQLGELLITDIVFSLVYPDRYEQTIYRIPGVGCCGTWNRSLNYSKNCHVVFAKSYTCPDGYHCYGIRRMHIRYGCALNSE